MQKPMNPCGSIEGTANVGTGATAVLFPINGPHNEYAKQFIVTNLGAVTLYFKKGPATGLDATNNNDPKNPRIAIGAGKDRVFTRGNEETHFYAYASAGCDYSIVCGSGE